MLFTHSYSETLTFVSNGCLDSGHVTVGSLPFRICFIASALEVLWFQRWAGACLGNFSYVRRGSCQAVTPGESLLSDKASPFNSHRITAADELIFTRLRRCRYRCWVIKGRLSFSTKSRLMNPCTICVCTLYCVVHSVYFVLYFPVIRIMNSAQKSKYQSGNKRKKKCLKIFVFNFLEPFPLILISSSWATNYMKLDFEGIPENWPPTKECSSGTEKTYSNVHFEETFDHAQCGKVKYWRKNSKKYLQVSERKNVHAAP